MTIADRVIVFWFFLAWLRASRRLRLIRYGKWKTASRFTPRAWRRIKKIQYVAQRNAQSAYARYRRELRRVSQ